MKAQFYKPIHIELSADGQNWILTESLKYEDSDGRLLTVPVGFKTDFASIPPLSTIGGLIIALGLVMRHFVWVSAILTLVGLVPVLLCNTLEKDDMLDAPATVHDWGYRVIRGRKSYWDRVFWRAMGATKRPIWKRTVLFTAVSLFGWLAWRRSRF